MSWTFDNLMPFLIVAVFALAGFLLHRIGRSQRHAAATRPRDTGDDGDLATFLSMSTAGDSCDGGGGCGGD